MNMKKTTLLLIAVLSVGTMLYLSIPRTSSAWGFWAHKEIHRYAIQSLPEEMSGFFREHAETIIQRAVEPDTRRHTDVGEEFYHYIDIDRYGPFPFTELPRNYDEAVRKFGKEKVDSSGTIPWRIVDFIGKLSDAMRRKNKEDILYYVSYIGHYVADIHVPLHTTDNYDGQLTDQKGIHSRWESRLPEIYGASYKLAPQEVQFIEDPLNYLFDVVLISYAKVDSLLKFDIAALESLPESKRFKLVERRGTMERQFSEEYYEAYHKLLNGMVERRINESIRGVASVWYTAWINAGKPNLNSIWNSIPKNGER